MATAAPRRPLVVEVLVVVHQISDHGWVAYPLADPSLAATGTEDVSLDELELFLGEHLPGLPPRRLAAFSFPEGTEIRQVAVPFVRSGLSGQRWRLPAIDVPCVVVPGARHLWVMALPLEATFTVGRNEDLAPTLSDEMRRFVAAREPSPLEFLEMLPGGTYRLETLNVRLDPDAPRASEARRRGAAAQKRRREAAKVLESIGRRLEREEQLPPRSFVGRTSELRQLTALLGGAERRSVLLVGPAATGKSAIVRRWLRGSGGRRALLTSAADFLAGISGFGEWQERLDAVMKALEELDEILYFEDFDDLFSDLPSGLVDLPGAMKRYLDEGRVRVLAEATPEAVDRAEARNPGFAGLFHRVRVEPLGRSETREVLERRLGHGKDRTGPELDPAIVPPLIELVDRYLPYESFPGKAVELLEAVRASADGEAADEVVPVSRLYEVFSLRTGIPPFLLRDDSGLEAERVSEWFRERVVGQEQAVRQVVETICVLKAQLQPAGKPLATFLFVGPTGVGKTELARTLARFLFGSDERLARFDMSEYQDPDGAERLIHGSDRDDGLLTRRIRQQPFSVLLLDEIEKAHPTVFDLLLQVTGEARLSDARGRTAYFHNTILIMTSNLGTRHRDTQIGWQPRAVDAGVYEGELRATFRPEFLNRIDRVVAFRPLTVDEARAVTRLTLDRLARRPGLLEAGVRLEVSEAALADLARQGYSEVYGARALRRCVEDRLVAPLAALFARVGARAAGAWVRATATSEPEPTTDGVFATAEMEGLRLQLARGPSNTTASRRDELARLQEISSFRRDVDRWHRMDRVEQAADELRAWRVELVRRAVASVKRDGSRASLDLRSASLGKAVERYQRLIGQLDQALAARSGLRGLEEQALLRLVEAGGEDRALERKARDSYRRYREALLRILVAGFPQRHHITLRLQILDPEVFSLWLRPLAREAERRQWRILFHLYEAPRSGPEWPALEKRRWGPPLEAGALWGAVGERRYRHLLIRCSGDEAGSLLTTEVGLHRYEHWAETDRPALVQVDRMALRSELSEADWARPELVPSNTSRDLLRRAPAVREWNGQTRELQICERRRRRRCGLDDYWAEIEEIALDHFLAVEEDRRLSLEDLFYGPLDSAAGEGGEP